MPVLNVTVTPPLYPKPELSKVFKPVKTKKYFVTKHFLTEPVTRKRPFVTEPVATTFKTEAVIITKPKIKIPEEEMCLEDYQMTMLEQHNRYRELNFMDPLVVSKKLQYVALLTAQRCSETKNVKEAVKKTSIYFTDQMSIIQNKGSINECRKKAILVSESWYENREYWTALMEDRNYKYLGCAVSIKKEIGCHVCLYQGERGKLKLQQNKVPGQSRIDLDSYADNFWNSY